ncbi:Gfo/Idh/MocA family oxidoreductase [Niabella ginsengisoli]|uniref:Gfo/Idh/MocA family oxidoreductase n=1 Tax=Niabella ginsengisoli TaxID=522298 RepID=A0ABS9SQV9_9BACT|nr:Gfo/Idh/MocA family oxidoreductase [Niabella ginsengisoli]MCH5600752.1 Gfo/Idh/MocA family oxidoreductase [Niabella ginsengisoli]
MNNRRDFLKSSAIIGAGALFPLEMLASIKSKVSPNDKIGVGVIGCKGMGWSDLTALLKVPEVTCVAICDIDEDILNQRKADLDKLNIKPKLYGDYRKLLADKDVDVVVVGTPDHWHCLQMIDACAAGKDVYCEKPISNSIYEAQLMNKAVQRYDRVVQVGQWQRSQQHFRDAIAFVHSGKLGKVSSTKAWMYRGGTTPLTVVPNSPVPAGVNYDMWLGPSQKRAFNKNRFHYEFRWFWDYAGGLMTDWGVHLIDMVLMGMKAGTPKSVMATGGKYVFPDDARETPDIQTALYDFGDFQMSWEHNMATGVGLYGMQHGIAFIGENGTLLLNRQGWEVKGEKDKMESIAWAKSVDRGLDLHAVNFIDVVKSRKKEDLHCPIDAGAKVAITSHFGNIALRAGEKIYWDEAKNKFNVDKATKLVKPIYQNGWKLPVV